MAFDPQCYELARYFSPYGATQKMKDGLAQHIQDAVETWLQIERDHEEDEREEYPDHGPTDPWQTSGPGKLAQMLPDPRITITDRGPSIGTYRDRDIPEWLDMAGRRFAYDRPAIQDRDGTTPLAQLRPDEFVVAPGLVYRRVP